MAHWALTRRAKCLSERSLRAPNASVTSQLHLQTGNCNWRQDAGAASAQPYAGHTQGPYRPPYKPHKGQQQSGTACAGGPRAGHLVHMSSPLVGHLVHMLSPLVGHYTHDTQRTPCQPKAPQAHSPEPTFPNTLVHPTTTQSRPLPICPPTPRCDSCRARGEGRKTLPLQVQHIKSGTSAPTSLLVRRFSGPRWQERPSSKACSAEMG